MRADKPIKLTLSADAVCTADLGSVQQWLMLRAAAHAGIGNVLVCGEAAQSGVGLAYRDRPRQQIISVCPTLRIVSDGDLDAWLHGALRRLRRSNLDMIVLDPWPEDRDLGRWLRELSRFKQKGMVQSVGGATAHAQDLPRLLASPIVEHVVCTVDAVSPTWRDPLIGATIALRKDVTLDVQPCVPIVHPSDLRALGGMIPWASRFVIEPRRMTELALSLNARRDTALPLRRAA